MVLSPQQTINHTPPPSQHVQHLQPTHTPLPIEVGTLQHPHPKAVSTVTTYIRKLRGRLGGATERAGGESRSYAVCSCWHRTQQEQTVSFSFFVRKTSSICRNSRSLPPLLLSSLRLRGEGPERAARGGGMAGGGRHHTHPPSEDVRRRRSTHTLPPFLTG